MLRLRIGVEGKLMGFIAIKWTLVARDIKTAELPAAKWVCSAIHDTPIDGAKYLTGKVFAVLSA